MICLRCGFCCIPYMMPIPTNPDNKYGKDYPQVDADIKTTKDKFCFFLCPYMIIHDQDNLKCSCQIHEKEWFKYTPCGRWTQLENNNDPCRLGQLVLLWKDYFKKYYTEKEEEVIINHIKDGHEIIQIIKMCQYFNNEEGLELLKQKVKNRELL